MYVREIQRMHEERERERERERGRGRNREKSLQNGKEKNLRLKSE